MQIRKATHKDAKKISYLIRKNVDNVKENLYTGEQIKAWKNENTPPKVIKENLSHRTTFVAFQNNKLVGTIGLMENILVGFYISYRNRGQGLGNRLLIFIENYARKNNISELHLTTTPNGFGFYLKNGYKFIGKVKNYYSGIEFIETKMAKTLDK